MSSINSQFPTIGEHHAPYDAIDPATTLKGSCAGKVVFITGASRGIGRAVALAFAQAGAKALYLTARSEQALAQVKADVAAAYPATQCGAMATDVTKADDVQAAVDDCVSRFGAIDVADANAGYLGPWLKIAESDPVSWWKTWEVNVKGVYLVARYCLPHLINSARVHAGKGATGGHLILMSSVGAQLLLPGASDYQTSKHAINRLCEFIHADHGEEGVKCFALHPGGVDTQLARNMPEHIHQYLTDAPELAAGFIVWLCGGRADWASGRYLSSTWDIDDLLAMNEKIINDDLLVNRLRTQG
jgi:NAD(P)-dependent dehydrogenase (short-subunit alcohol dehydrogenase family)